MGCAKVSKGCKNCYAERDMKRFGRDFGTPTRSKTTFEDPLKWEEPRRIFVCSWSDFFLETVPDQWRIDAYMVMHAAPQHTFMLLTKRPQNMAAMLPDGWSDGMWHQLPNVWLGVSAENQRRADDRITLLLQVPAAVHFVSAEPLLGPLDLREYLPLTDASAALRWIIVGGESDPTDPRLMDLDWARSIRDQCQEAGVAFFHKQSGGKRLIDDGGGKSWGGRELDGRIWSEFPKIE